MRLLHLLAHHPDCGPSHEQLIEMSLYVSLPTTRSPAKTLRIRYIKFYLDLIATADTVSLLYHLATKTKTVRDAESHAYSEVWFS